jgi:uncharacterized membrane protein
MKALKTFVTTTLFGGVMFLLPVVLLLIVLRHGLQFAGKLAGPVATLFPATRLAGIGLPTLIAVLILLLLAFLAGLLSRTSLGRRLMAWFEESILGGMPQYRMVRSMAEGLTQIESGEGMQPVLVRGDEGWQLAYRLEDLPGNWVAVFLPQSPTPMSGNVLYVAAHKVRALEIGMATAMKLVKSVGIGSAAALQGVDLGPAHEA